MRNLFFLFLSTALFISCSKNIEPIVYGEEVCEFCSMTIVDQTHSAQIVTQKGKNHKFDSSECMIQYIDNELEEDELMHVLSANYLNPGELVNAKEATFLVSENIPSPMGGFLTALENEEDAEKVKEDSGGELYDWKEIQDYILNQNPLQP